MDNQTWIAILVTFMTYCYADAHHTYGNYSGDIVLAAYFPVHGSTADLSVPFSGHKYCGEIHEEDGIQTLEAFYYALDAVNKDENLLPGITLGGVTIDSCNSEQHTLEQAMELIQVLMMRGEVNDNIPFVCQDGSAPNPDQNTLQFWKVVGVVGGSSSTVSIQLASLLRLFFLPQISYLSTSPDLSNADRFPYFKRTVPSDSIQATAIVQLLMDFNWTYVSVIYEDSNYGVQGHAELEKAALLHGICFASAHRVNYHSTSWSDEDYDAIVADVAQKERARAVILWLDYPRAREILAAAQRLNVRKIWVGSDGWSSRTTVTDGYEEAALGAVTLQPLASELQGFDRYFTNLSPFSNPRNPWFQEFWENHFECEFNPTGSFQRCTGDEKLSISNGYRPQTYLHFVHDAVFSFAHALTQMQRDLCGENYSGMCEAMSPEKIDGAVLLDYLGDVSFSGASGLLFDFHSAEENGVKLDGPPRYSIMNFRQNKEHGNFSWRDVGNYSGLSTEQDLQFEPDFEWDMKGYPLSVCSDPCGVGQYKQSTVGDRCCWVCTNCSDYHVVVTVLNEQYCRPCHDGSMHDETRTTCIVIPETFVTYTSGFSLVSMSFALLGILCTMVVLVIFLKFWHTPVIKASGRELSLYLLGGILLSFLSTFLLVNQPSEVICGVTRILIGLCFTIVYTSVLTKTNRISRIFNNGTSSPQKAKYTSPRSQLLIVNIMVLIEVVILTVWLAMEPPRTLYIYPSRDQNVLVCAGAENASYLIALIYPLVILLLCTYYAFKTRKTPDGFNETKLIGFTCYTTCIIWLAFITLYLSSTNTFLRTATICLSVSLNAFVALGCLFVPKLYICLFKPGKNTREAVMTRTGSVISDTSNFPPTMPSFDISGIKQRRSYSNASLNIMDRNRKVSLDPISKHFKKNSSSLGALPCSVIPNVTCAGYGYLRDEDKSSSSPDVAAGDKNNKEINISPLVGVAVDDINVHVVTPVKNI